MSSLLFLECSPLRVLPHTAGHSWGRTNWAIF
jgi:hypothetical protein